MINSVFDVVMIIFLIKLVWNIAMPAWGEWTVSKKKAFGPIKPSHMYMAMYMEVIAAVLLIILNFSGQGRNWFSNSMTLVFFCFGSVIVSILLAIYINRYLREKL